MLSEAERAEKKARKKKWASFFFLLLGLLSAGLGLYIGLYQQSWPLALMMFGFALFFPLAIYGGPLIEKHQEAWTDALEKLGLLPKPTEAYMYVISLSLMFVFFFSDIWMDVLYLLSENGKFFWIVLYTFLGMGYSIYFAFSRRAKTAFEIQVLKYYSAVFAAGLAVATGIYAYQSQVEGYYIFTVWNGIQAFVLLFLSGSKHVGEYIRLPTREARRIELILGTIVVVAVLGIEKLYFDAYWAAALSTVLIVWAIVEGFFHQFPQLRLNSPIMGRELTKVESKEIQKRHAGVRTAVLYGVLALVLTYLGFMIGDLIGALIGLGIGLAMYKWMRV